MPAAKPHALVIGAGFTGCATAHDLALRGFDVTIVERGEIASGTSGRTHGLLHSGGRYCVNDQESAIECIEEDGVLRRIVAQCIEPNGGLFVALTDADLAYADAFLKGAAACGIPVTELSPQQALRLEPSLNPKLKAAFAVPDGTFDPLRLALAFAATAKAKGATFHTYTEVCQIITDGQGKVIGVGMIHSEQH
jgi:glycerol-3-phosphate dehydrogenase